MEEQNQELQRWWQACCEAQDTISEQQDNIERNYTVLKDLADITNQYDGLIAHIERKIERTERCLTDSFALPEEQRYKVAERLEAEIEKHYEKWWGLLDERDKVAASLFDAVDNIPLLKKAKERLEYRAFMTEVGRYTAVCRQQVQDWVDAGCPDDDEERLH